MKMADTLQSPFRDCWSKFDSASLLNAITSPCTVELFVPAVALQDEILRRAVPKPMGGREIPFTTPEDLILLKLVFHRMKDMLDVRGILWVQRGRLDLDYLRNWSAKTHEPHVQQEMEQLIVEYANDTPSD